MLAGALVAGTVAAFPSLARAEPGAMQSHHASVPLDLGDAPTRSCAAAVHMEGWGILLTGGFVGGNPTRSVQLIDPSRGTSMSLPPMLSARAQHAAVALNDGRVLVMGGFNQRHLASVELFDPQAGQWFAMPDLPAPRADFQGVATWNSVHLLGGTGLFGLMGNAVYRLQTESQGI